MLPTQPEQSTLDLTNFVKDLKIERGVRPLIDNHREKHFEPIPNGFYGFSIDLSDMCWRHDGVPVEETIDIPYEDLTNQKLIE